MQVAETSVVDQPNTLNSWRVCWRCAMVAMSVHFINQAVQRQPAGWRLGDNAESPFVFWVTNWIAWIAFMKGKLKPQNNARERFVVRPHPTLPTASTA